MKLAIAVGLSIFCAGAADLEQAQKLYSQTEFEQSLNVLAGLPVTDGTVLGLMGQDYFMLGEYKKATEVLEKAVAAQPFNSDWALWLGRAWGRRAETANPISAMAQASKARQNFEKAIQLNPRNTEALNDLLEYYLEAPGFLGGGIEKAKAVAVQIGALNSAEGHWAQAKIDEKRKELGSAEVQLRRAIEMAPHQIGRMIDLARFFARQGRYQESDQSFARAEQISPESPKLMYARADVYIKTHRNLEVARNLLERYLTADITPEDPPKSQARKLLRQAQGS
ncbi:MAG: hypothetical protein JO323_26300 [Acidobacteriia bacterium]|nr:hypothetical protein [Terriglobia bacterium]